MPFAVRTKSLKPPILALAALASQATLASGGEQRRDSSCLQPHSMGILWFSGRSTSFRNQTWVPTLAVSLTS